MKIPSSRKRIGSAGFTIMEIIIAILILAASLTTLLGLQSASIRRTFTDKNQQKAMLAARAILSAIEVQSSADDVQSDQGTVIQVLKNLIPLPPVEIPVQDPLNLFTAELIVTPAKLPGLDGDVMKQAILKVSWGETEAESLSLNYFIANSDLSAGGSSDSEEDEEDEADEE
ncbi:MAG: hypothetical protein R3A13_10620 [Bdellovibrionota bacterium]